MSTLITREVLGSDHNLILGKKTLFRSPSKMKSIGETVHKHIESFKDVSAMDLYQRHVSQKIDNTPIAEQDTVNTA